MSGTITVLLVDDHTLVREMLGRRLDEERDLQVVGTARTADEALTEAARLAPDIVLMDIDMPGMVCFEAARMLQSGVSLTRVIFLSAFFSDRYIEQALAVRAWGYLVKNEPVAVVVAAIRRVKAGEELNRNQVVAAGAGQLLRPAMSAMGSSQSRPVDKVLIRPEPVAPMRLPCLEDVTEAVHP